VNYLLNGPSSASSIERPDFRSSGFNCPSNSSHLSKMRYILTRPLCCRFTLHEVANRIQRLHDRK
jgi:hypothetical protein